MGLYLWNEQVRAGWETNPPPPVRPQQTERPSPVETGRVIETSAREPDIEPPTPMDPVLPEREPEAALAQPEYAETKYAASVEVAEALAMLSPIVERVFADAATWPGWTFEAAAAQWRCPSGRRLFPYSAVPASKAGAARISLRTEPHACSGCPIRATCFSGNGVYKQLVRNLTAAELETAQNAMATLRRARARRAPRRIPRKEPRAPAAPRPTRSDSPVFTAPNDVAAGPLYFEKPRFLPAVARRMVRQYARSVDIRLRVGPPTNRPPKHHPLVASGPRDRFHGRLRRSDVNAKQTVERHTRVTTHTSASFTESS